MALLGPAAAQLSASPPGKLPDPVAFAVQMELGNAAQASAWLDAGLPPDFMGSRTGSGLMIGAWEGHLDLMQLFLARGADINRLNGNGESAIALAAWRGHLAAVKWLLEQGARLNAPPHHWSALHYAVFAGHREVARFLIEQGADIDAQSSNGSSVLMMAIYEGHEELARTLIEKGANRGLKNDWGDGALDWAMRFNHLNIARLVSNAEEFKAAVSQPKEKWGEAQRSMRTSKELEELLSLRATLVERQMSPDTIDKRIAAERARIVRAELARSGPPSRAATLEISASRKSPKAQSTQIIHDEQGKAVGYKAPPATYFGTPRMPPAGKVKGY